MDAQTVLESIPVRADHLTRFTPETSKAMAAKAVEARKQRAKDRANRTPQPPVNADDKTGMVQYARECVENQLRKINEQLDADGIEPKEWDMLTRAKDRLFKEWTHLISLPGPGQLKPASPRSSRQHRQPIVPMEPEG